MIATNYNQLSLAMAKLVILLEKYDITLNLILQKSTLNLEENIIR